MDLTLTLFLVVITGGHTVSGESFFSNSIEIFKISSRYFFTNYIRKCFKNVLQIRKIKSFKSLYLEFKVI